MNATTRSGLLTVVAVAGIVVGCVTASTREDARRIDIADGAYLELPRAGEITGSFDATQVIVATYGEESHSFEAHVQVNPGNISDCGPQFDRGALVLDHI